MVDDKRVPGEGDVKIELGGEELVLRPSYGAAKSISAQLGGIQGAINRVLQMDLDAVMTVIQLGLGYSPTNKAPKELAEKIWAQGLTDDTGGLLERCVLYLRVLASGGRLPKEEARDDTSNPQS